MVIIVILYHKMANFEFEKIVKTPDHEARANRFVEEVEALSQEGDDKPDIMVYNFQNTEISTLNFVLNPPQGIKLEVRPDIMKLHRQKSHEAEIEMLKRVDVPVHVWKHGTLESSGKDRRTVEVIIQKLKKLAVKYSAKELEELREFKQYVDEEAGHICSYDCWYVFISAEE